MNYALSAMLLACVSITNPDYTPQNYQVFLLTIFIMIIHGIISSMPTRWIAEFNSAGSTFNIIALFVVIIVIPACNNRADRGEGLTKWNSNADVWGQFYVGTDFPNGVAVLMSFISVIWTMSGYDAPFHLAGKLRSILLVCYIMLTGLQRNAPMPTSPLPELSS